MVHHGEAVMKNSDMPAMPTHDVFEDCGFDGNGGPHLTQTTNYGMTKREMMAMHIMSGYVANSKAVEAGELMCMHDVASYSVECADALLAELERTK